MRRVKGMRDIVTHGSLAREGRLISVARDGFCRTASQRSDAGGIASDWDIKRHIFQKPRNFSDFAKLTAREIELTHGMLKEFDEALGEGIPVSSEAHEQLKAKLVRLRGF
ncbi:MAG: hypothetical protein HYT21_02685 [Candidatus Nealsonbacteria bacterium]|nr:hypothetical protein [Candidatus Nealsonbacteria bacterium]